MVGESDSRSDDTGVSDRQGELSKSPDEAMVSASLRTDWLWRTESSADRLVMTEVTSPWSSISETDVTAKALAVHFSSCTSTRTSFSSSFSLSNFEYSWSLLSNSSDICQLNNIICEVNTKMLYRAAWQTISVGLLLKAVIQFSRSGIYYGLLLIIISHECYGSNLISASTLIFFNLGNF